MQSLKGVAEKDSDCSGLSCSSHFCIPSSFLVCLSEALGRGLQAPLPRPSNAGGGGGKLDTLPHSDSGLSTFPCLPLRPNPGSTDLQLFVLGRWYMK